MPSLKSFSSADEEDDQFCRNPEADRFNSEAKEEDPEKMDEKEEDDNEDDMKSDEEEEEEEEVEVEAEDDEDLEEEEEDEEGKGFCFASCLYSSLRMWVMLNQSLREYVCLYNVKVIDFNFRF